MSQHFSLSSVICHNISLCHQATPFRLNFTLTSELFLILYQRNNDQIVVLPCGEGKLLYRNLVLRKVKHLHQGYDLAKAINPGKWAAGLGLPLV